MKALRLATVSGLLVLASAFLVAQAPPSSGSLTGNPVFQNNCAKCHGKTADGRFILGPTLVSGKTSSMSADDLRNIITNGKGHMPKYGGKLSADEINTLVLQIKAIGNK